ncbi:hypothetical protein N7449_010075 [Penicillium cf. viridicatum]|uniref:Uncharacterized protein n=1 Tax=Penicillium cf. viridicatum TaxID=2972119 RepID=A0A9W9J3R6_9EURO|nr:hypothetical protein N7449_010075 [Penicillium cf. viridicatum]
MVEVRVSKSYRKLKADIEWWLTNSKGDINLIIIVSINRTTPNIKHQLLTTLAAPLLALTIEFKELCCCQPVLREHDIEISPDQLADISSEVWMEQRWGRFLYTASTKTANIEALLVQSVGEKSMLKKNAIPANKPKGHFLPVLLRLNSDTSC